MPHVWDLVRFLVVCVLAFTFIVVSPAHAQTGSASPSNLVGVELLGRAVLYSVNYERSIARRIGLGIGVATVSVRGWWISSTRTTTMFLPMYVSLNPLGDTHSLYVATGITPMLRRRTSTYEGTRFFVEATHTATLGYQYRSSDSGLVIRPTINYISYDRGLILWPGVTIGRTW
jgi:hypothetical protein